jgi:hypothetical protein
MNVAEDRFAQEGGSQIPDKLALASQKNPRGTIDYPNVNYNNVRFSQVD